MRLRRVRVENFRSIVDSGIVGVFERVTVLVGKNEQGKTNFLKGLASFNSKSSYSPSDLPNHLHPVLEERDPATIPIVTLWVAPEQSERQALKDALPNGQQIEEFRITRFYDGHYEYHLLKADGAETPVTFSSPDISALVDTLNAHATSLKAKLAAHGTRLPTFAPSVAQADAHIDQFIKSDFKDYEQISNLIKTFSTALKGLPGQDQAIQDDIAQATKDLNTTHGEIQQALQVDRLATFQRHLPHFLFHSTLLDRIPNEVSIADFIKDPESTSQGMANLCAVAGLPTQKIRELAAATDTARREVYEDHYRGSISGGINEFWTQETYNVHFRIEKEKLSVSISDQTYSPRIPPSDRSDGFQWYLSFFAAILSEVSATDPMVLLLDNPGLELHADGQRDIKRFLEEKLPSPTQVIYVTHSPAMIDPYNLDKRYRAGHECHVVACEAHYVRLLDINTRTYLSEPLENVKLARDEKRYRLMLIVEEA